MRKKNVQKSFFENVIFARQVGWKPTLNEKKFFNLLVK